METKYIIVESVAEHQLRMLVDSNPTATLVFFVGIILIYISYKISGK
jgi:hypothetical protein